MALANDVHARLDISEKREKREGRGWGIGNLELSHKAHQYQDRLQDCSGLPRPDTSSSSLWDPGIFYHSGSKQEEGEIYSCVSQFALNTLFIMPQLQAMVHIIISLQRFTGPAHPEKCTNCKPRSV